jgi:hypothetical protein
MLPHRPAFLRHAPPHAHPARSRAHTRCALSLTGRRARTQNDRLSEVLKTMKWEEPISRPKGRAREDVLIAALEDVLRATRNKTEADRKASEQVRAAIARGPHSPPLSRALFSRGLLSEELPLATAHGSRLRSDCRCVQARIQMMEQLGRAEDEMLEKDHELLQVKEDREKHFRMILDQQERLAREILLRKEERISLALKQQEHQGLLKQREALVESLMKRQQELQMRLSRMGDMERELENVRSKLTSTEDAREAISKRCDGLGEKSRGLESALEAANEEVRRNAELAQTAEDKLASALAASPMGSPAQAAGWSGVLNNAAAAAGGGDGAGGIGGAAGGAGGGVGAVGGVGPHTPHSGTPHMPHVAPPGMHGGGGGPGGATPPESPSTEEVMEYAKFLGMNIGDDRDKELLWIAKEAMAAALPAGWTQHEDKDGFVFFYNAATEQSTYEHPMDEFYRKVYQRAKTTAERDPATLKQHTTATATASSSSSSSSSTTVSPSGGGGFFRRSPGGSGGSMPVGILKQPKAPEAPTAGSPPLMHANQYAERLRALEAENERLRTTVTQGDAGNSSSSSSLPRAQSMAASTPTHSSPHGSPEPPPIQEHPQQQQQQEAEDDANDGGLSEEDIAKIPNPYGLSREALVKKFLFDQQRAHKNSTARARKSSQSAAVPSTPTGAAAAAATPDKSASTAGGGGGGGVGGLSVTVPSMAAGGIAMLSTPSKVNGAGGGGGNGHGGNGHGGSSVSAPTLGGGGNGNGNGNGNGSSNGNGGPQGQGQQQRLVGQASATPRPSDKAVEIMDQQGIMQIPQGTNTNTTQPRPEKSKQTKPKRPPSLPPSLAKSDQIQCSVLRSAVWSSTRLWL